MRNENMNNNNKNDINNNIQNDNNNINNIQKTTYCFSKYLL